MYKSDKEMSLSPEDLSVVIACLVVLILAFTDIRSDDTIAFASFPAIGILLVSWGIVRFRRRPLPKQVHFKRMIYLSSIKVLRNYHFIQIILGYLFILFRYPAYQNKDFLIALIFNFVALFFTSILEFAGHVLVPDNIEVLIKLDDEDDKLFLKKRFKLLFGTRFYIIISIFTLISLGMTYFPIVSIFTSQDIVLIIMQFVTLPLAIGWYLFIYYKTMSFDRIKDPSLLLKAIDYYESADLIEEGFKLIENHLEVDPNNIVLVSRLALMHTKEGNYDKTLEYTGKVLAEIGENYHDRPHMTSRAHLLRAISLNAKERYQEAYDEVIQTLKITPENNSARKLRRDLRRKLKSME